MHIDDLISRFTFGTLGVQPAPNDSILVVRVPAAIRTRGQLLDLLAAELRFPEYFGGNWDALFDRLCDLRWLPQRRIVVAHEGIPRHMAGEELATYVGILADTVQWWRTAGHGHEFVALFPESARQVLTELVSS